MAETQNHMNVMAATTCVCVENTGIIFLGHQMKKVKEKSIVHNGHAHSCSFFLWRAVFKTHK